MYIETSEQLLQEIALADAFFERSLFFSNSSDLAAIASKEVPIFLSFTAALSAVGLTFASRLDKQTISRGILAINARHSIALQILGKRLNRVVTEYQKARDEVKKLGLAVSDRDGSYGTTESIKPYSKCEALLKSVIDDWEANPRLASNVCAFKTVREIGILFMDEIKYLSGRIDTFVGLSNAAKAHQKTDRAFFLARWAFIATCFFAILNLVLSIVNLARQMGLLH
jgi:hypothetical protein